MNENWLEQASLFQLTFKSGLSTRIIHTIIAAWRHQLGRTLEEFMVARTEEWKDACQLDTKWIEKLEQICSGHDPWGFQEYSQLEQQLTQQSIHLLTIFDEHYPRQLKLTLKPQQLPLMLYYMGDLSILDRPAIAIIGSRKASEHGLRFTHEVSQYLADYEINIISGNARGVDQVASAGATSRGKYTTLVLPHGIRKITKERMQSLLPEVQAGRVLLISQFHPDNPWSVIHAMERNKVIIGLAQAVIVAESDSKGGTWEGAKEALKHGRHVYVRQTDATDALPGNRLLLGKGGLPLPWPVENLAAELASLLEASGVLQVMNAHDQH